MKSKKALEILKNRAEPVAIDEPYVGKSTAELATEDEHEIERTFKVNADKLPPLPVPWCIVQGYFDCIHPNDEASIRLIPSRKIAFIRRKSNTPEIRRAKISAQVDYTDALKLLDSAPRVAVKERHLVRDEHGRAWLVDYFPILNKFYVESEFDSMEQSNALDKSGNFPDWVGDEVTNVDEGYTRTRAKSMTANKREQELKYAEENGNMQTYLPSEDPNFKWQEQDGTWQA